MRALIGVSVANNHSWPRKNHLLLKCFFMLQYEVKQFGHVARWLGRPGLFIVSPRRGEEALAVTTGRGVIVKERGVGAAARITRALTLEHVRLWDQVSFKN